MSGDGRGERPDARAGDAGRARPGVGRGAGAVRGDGESRLAKLRIMSKEVTIACRPGEEDALEQAAAYIDASMRELKSRNATSSIEKIAIVTAINTADALLRARADGTAGAAADDAPALARMAAMNERLDALLGEHAASAARDADDEPG